MILSGAITYGTQFSFTSDPTPALGLGKVTLVRPGSDTHHWNPDQRYIELNKTITVDALTGQHTIYATASANANIAPPGWYFLFLVTEAGVPSVGKFVYLS